MVRIRCATRDKLFLGIQKMLYHITLKSSNKKTGPIPVTTSSKETCPDSCPLKANGCYAESGPLAIHWREVTNGNRGVNANKFFQAIRRFPGGQLWRHNQAGDLPHHTGQIDSVFLSTLVKANRGRRGFTYTHHLPTQDNVKQLTEANEKGFTVNLSANNTAQAVQYMRLYKLPVTTVLPMDAPNSQTIDGVQIVACPAEKSDKVSCATCALCADSKRPYIIGFRAHGTGKRKAQAIALRQI